MKTRCKFKCTQISIMEGSGSTPILHSVKFQPVYGNGDPNHENTKFWTWTPGGSLDLNTIKPQGFEVGKEYYLDISLAAPAEGAKNGA
jgi:hypothetical protein